MINAKFSTIKNPFTFSKTQRYFLAVQKQMLKNNFRNFKSLEKFKSKVKYALFCKPLTGSYIKFFNEILL